MENIALDQSRYRFRRLRPEDYPVAAVLIEAAIGDLAAFFTGADSEAEARVRLQALVAARGTRFSHEFAIGIACLSTGELAAIGSAYGEKEMDALTARSIAVSEAMGWTLVPEIKQRLLQEREAPVGTYYIDHLAVSPQHQGNALGTALIQMLIQQGKTYGYFEVSLLADIHNPNAQRLYERLGFQLKERVRANGHDYNALIFSNQKKSL